MRKVYYGRFVDFMPVSDDYDDGLIGGHIYARNSQRAALRTAGYEYYVVEDGQYYIVDKPTILEKLSARVKFLFQPYKKRVLGERRWKEKKSKVNPYSDSNPQLGIRLDSDGRKVVDDDYYDDAHVRSEEKDSPVMAADVKEKRKLVEKYVESLANQPVDEETNRTKTHIGR